MFDLRLLAIPLVVLALVAVLCWALVYARGHWRVRLAVIAVLPSLSLLVWSALPSYMGWPTTDVPEGKVLLLWADFREPDQKTGDEGALYLWAVPIGESEEALLDALEYPRGAGQPRAFELPYSRAGHEMLARARERIAGGGMMVLEMTGEGSGDPGMRDGDGSGQNTDGRGDSMREGDDADFRVYDLPAASYPEKEE